MPSLGAHESIAGGLHLAFDRILSVGGRALQIFTRNQRQWKAAPLSEAEITAFRAAWSESGRMPVASHASYLVNLASARKDLAARSVAAFAEELRRCRLLGIPWVVIHPGSHGGAGVSKGLSTVAANLDRVFVEAGEDGEGVLVLLETTAGQGTGLGSRFEELAAIREQSAFADRLKFCVDTCHIFAAGYDISTKAGYAETIAEMERLLGLDSVLLFHLNDSRKELGSRVDRHEHIGRGYIGLEGFANLLRDPRFADLPMVLETPKSSDLHEDRENLDLLNGLLETRP